MLADKSTPMTKRLDNNLCKKHVIFIHVIISWIINPFLQSIGETVKPFFFSGESRWKRRRLEKKTKNFFLHIDSKSKTCKTHSIPWYVYPLIYHKPIPMDASWEMLGIAGVLGETECCIKPSTFLWTICKGRTFQHPTKNRQKTHVTYIWPNYNVSPTFPLIRLRSQDSRATGVSRRT